MAERKESKSSVEDRIVNVFKPPNPMSKAEMNSDGKMWAMFLHFSVFAGYAISIAGLVAPILIWQFEKSEYPEIDAHGKIVVNFLISIFIYLAVAGLLVVLLIGIPMLIALGIAAVVLPAIGGIKANNDEIWPYPLTIQFLH